MPLPPVTVVPLKLAGAVPEQMVCAALTALFPSTGLTVTCTAADVSEQFPERAILLNQVVTATADGFKCISVSAAALVANPAVALVTDFSH
jgi:hypothetical protein